MTLATALASVTSQTIAVEHIRISSRRPFAEVRRKLEGTVPKLDSGVAEVLRSGDQEGAKIYEDNGQTDPVGHGDGVGVIGHEQAYGTVHGIVIPPFRN